MRRTTTYPFLGVGIFLFFWVNLPRNITDQMRSFGASLFTHRSFAVDANEVARLQLENQSLRAQIDHAHDWLLSDLRTGEQLELLKDLEKRPQCKARASHLKEILKSQMVSVPAQVVYRDPSSWSSSVWVNVGEDNNKALGKNVITKNSPVLADGALVGVVDYVGKKQARIRLITDSGLAPSVRINRGPVQNRELAYQLQGLLNQVEKRDDLFATDVEKKDFVKKLDDLKTKSGLNWEDGYLAKGEVHGSSAPFWRSRSPILKGIGFHFDGFEKAEVKVPILKEGDLLVTSGLDGVFPPGLRVGTVLAVDDMKEGGYSYDIEVRPAAGHLNDLQNVFILPPLSE